MEFLRNKEHKSPANKTTNREYLSNHRRATDVKVANTYYQNRTHLRELTPKKTTSMEDRHGTLTDTANLVTALLGNNG